MKLRNSIKYLHCDYIDFVVWEKPFLSSFYVKLDDSKLLPVEGHYFPVNLDAFLDYTVEGISPCPGKDLDSILTVYLRKRNKKGV